MENGRVRNRHEVARGKSRNVTHTVNSRSDQSLSNLFLPHRKIDECHSVYRRSRRLLALNDRTRSKGQGQTIVNETISRAFVRSFVRWKTRDLAQ